MEQALAGKNRRGGDSQGGTIQRPGGLILADEYKSRLDGLAYGPRDSLRRIKIYTVREGDILESIAVEEMNDIKKAKELAFLNGLEVGAQLYTGQKLKVVY